MADESSEQPPLPRALPRPQRVLNPTLNGVPTKSALEAKARQAESFQSIRPFLSSSLTKQPHVTQLPTTKTRPVALASGAIVASRSTTIRDITKLYEVPVVSNETLSLSRERDKSPTKVGLAVSLGTFTQDGEDWDLRTQKNGYGLLMAKTRSISAGLAEKRVCDLSSHENIIQLLDAVKGVEFMELSFEYARFTLAQIHHVHLKLKERQIQCIAGAVFGALKHLAQNGMAHHRVQAKNIRFTTPDIRIVLANFEAVTDSNGDNSDLKDLGFVLLECMEGHTLPTDRLHMDYIANQRAINKVFGLSDAGRWSGCKDLIDFLDELFNENRTASAKYSKPHSFVAHDVHDTECIRPYIELVTMECFVLWTPKE